MYSYNELLEAMSVASEDERDELRRELSRLVNEMIREETRSSLVASFCLNGLGEVEATQLVALLDWDELDRVYDALVGRSGRKASEEGAFLLAQEYLRLNHRSETGMILHAC